MNKHKEIEERLAELNKRKKEAQKACHLEASKPLLPPVDLAEEEVDSLDWTAEQWRQREQVIDKSSDQGYKNLGQLAEATYKKELSLRSVDQEKYNKAMKASMDEPSYASTLAPEDVDALAQSLREASERRQKRRKVDEGGLYMNERNRQFNLKLNREYGDEKGN